MMNTPMAIGNKQQPDEPQESKKGDHCLVRLTQLLKMVQDRYALTKKKRLSIVLGLFSWLEARFGSATRILP